VFAMVVALKEVEESREERYGRRQVRKLLDEKCEIRPTECILQLLTCFISNWMLSSI
jgi:hypothetical protein